jgi:hypothetical protein
VGKFWPHRIRFLDYFIALNWRKSGGFENPNPADFHWAFGEYR